MNKDEKIFKFTFLGSPYVGKTSLLTRIADDTFQENYLSTIGCDFKIKKFQVDNQSVKAQLWDTAGQERFRTMISPSYLRGTHGIFFVFDVTDEKGFYEVQNTYEQYLPNINKGTPILLIGNKTDKIAERKIPFDIGKALADNIGAEYIETSALANSNCIEALQLITRLAIVQSNIQKPQVEQQQLLEEQQQKPVSKGCC